MDLFQLFASISLNTSDYENALKNASDKTDSFGSKLKNGLAGMAKAGAAAIGAASAAAVGFAKSAVDAGMSFDSSMSQVAATMGTSVDEIGELRDFAIEMGSKTAFSATEAADALNYMALAGYDAETSMAMLPNVLNLAAAGGIDLASASDMITDSQSALGLSLEETSELVDMMAQASSKSNTSVAQLGEALLTVGGTAKNLAGGTTELNTLLGILADNGVKGAEGGTALRNVILSLSAPTDTAALALENLGVQAFDSEGNMRPLNETFADMNAALSELSMQEKEQALNEIFNKVDLKSVKALLANTGAGIDGISEALNNSGIAWEKYSDTYWDSAEGMNNLIDEVLWNLTSNNADLEELQDYLHFEYDLDYEDALTVINTVAENADAAGSRFDELSGYIDDATGAAEKMAETQLDNLAGDITIFKSALEGAQITLSDQLTPGLREFVQFGTEGISSLTTAFQEGGLEGMMDALGDFLGQAVTKITEKLPMIIEAGRSLLEALLKGIVDNLPTIMPAVVQVLSSIASFIVDNLPMVIDAAIQIIMGLVDGLIQALPELIPATVEAIITITEGLIDNIDKLVDAAIEITVALAEGLIDALPRLLEKAPVIIAKLVEAIVKNLPKLLEAAAQIIAKLAIGIIDNLPEIGKAAGKIIGAVIKGVKDLISGVVDVGKNIVKGLWEGITSKWQWIKDKVGGFFKGIIGKSEDTLDINSPSKVFAGIGENMALGLGEGWDKSFDKVAGDIQDGLDFSGDLAYNTYSNGSAFGGGANSYGQGTQVVQNIYSQAKTAADLMEEARWNFDMAVAF